MSADVCHVLAGISESGMVEMLGVAAEIASPSLSVQYLFLLPVCVVAILRFPCQPTSDHVISGISESGMVDNVGFQTAILNSGSRHRRRPCSMLGLSSQ